MKTQILPFKTLSATQLTKVAHALEQGAVAALATDTVYGLATGAFCERAIQQIYALKERPVNMPLQLLVASVAVAAKVTQMNEQVHRVATTFWPGGLTLILPPSPSGQPLLRGFSGLGIRVPVHPNLQALLAQLTMPLACTSANVHGQPVLTHEKDVVNQFDGRVDFILTDGTLSPTASTVLDATLTPPRLLRVGTISKEDLTRIYKGPID